MRERNQTRFPAPVTTQHRDPLGFQKGSDICMKRLSVSLFPEGEYSGAILLLSFRGHSKPPPAPAPHRLFLRMTNPVSCDLSLAQRGRRNRACSFWRPQTFSCINHSAVFGLWASRMKDTFLGRHWSNSLQVSVHQGTLIIAALSRPPVEYVNVIPVNDKGKWNYS